MKDLKEFNEELRKKNLGGYWQTIQDVYREPASYAPHLWKWKDVDEAIRKAGDVIGLDASSRRVVQLRHPTLNGPTSHTLQLNIQMLKPGEHANAHRHTLAGIRFVIKGSGVLCIVDGENFALGEGDLLTTPNWTWHEHVNNSAEPVFWLDGLDSPLVRTLLPDIGFFEPHETGRQPLLRPDGTAAREFGFIRPSWVRSDSDQPPAYCYRWQDTEMALKSGGEKSGDPYDGILLQYVNPLTGGPTLPTLMCSIQMLRPGEKTKSHRHTNTAIYHVVRGKGMTTIGDIEYQWEAGDSFVVPFWRLHRHENRSDQNSILFAMTDRPIMELLGFYREDKAD
jgi:1-hydroxy-2-naphthoate dioxygenase